MPAHVQVKQFERSDQQAVLSFLPAAYPDDPRKSDPAFWKWHTLDNPYTSPNDVPLWLAKDGERVVGQVSSIPMEFNVDGNAQRATWVVDLVVLEEYRGQGLGKQLMLAARDYGPPVCVLGFNELSGPIMLSLKWTPLGPINRHQKLLFPGNALKETSKITPVRELVNLAYAPARRRLAKTSASNKFELFEPPHFDESFDDLRQRVRGQWPCSVARDSRFLEWQFRQQPDKRFEVFALRDGTRLAGYIVLFFRKPERGVISKVALTDICYDATYGDELIAALIETALSQSVKRRAGALVTDVLDQRVDSQLRRFGFWRIKPRASFMVYDPRARAVMYQAENWFLTRADSDVSIFEGPNL